MSKSLYCSRRTVFAGHISCSVIYQARKSTKPHHRISIIIIYCGLQSVTVAVMNSTGLRGANGGDDWCDNWRWSMLNRWSCRITVCQHHWLLLMVSRVDSWSLRHRTHYLRCLSSNAHLRFLSVTLFDEPRVCHWYTSLPDWFLVLQCPLRLSVMNATVRTGPLARPGWCNSPETSIQSTVAEFWRMTDSRGICSTGALPRPS